MSVATFECAQSFSICSLFPKYLSFPKSSPFEPDLKAPPLQECIPCHMYCAQSDGDVRNGLSTGVSTFPAMERMVLFEELSILVPTAPGKI